jgi:hypothetical protein
MRIRIKEQPATEKDIRRIIEFGARPEEIVTRQRLLKHLTSSCYLDGDDPKRVLTVRERLLEQYKNDGLVLFLGAGVSLGSGIPNWNTLIENIFRKIGIAPNIGRRADRSSIYAQFELAALRSGEREDFCKNLYDCLYSHAGFKHIKELLKKVPAKYSDQPGWKGWGDLKNKLAKNETLRDVGDLLIVDDAKKHAPKRNPRIHAVLTVNADNLLELYCLAKTSGSEQCPVTMVDRASVGDDPDAISVYHLHGTLDARDENFMNPCRGIADDMQAITDELLPRLVFRESEYYETIADPVSFVNHTPQSYFQRHNILFIGTSLEDLNIRRWLSSSFKERVKERTKYLQELHCKKYPDAGFEAKLESVRHFWLRPRNEKIDGKKISGEMVKLVELVMCELGIQIVWCDDLADIQRCIRELKERGQN